MNMPRTHLSPARSTPVGRFDFDAALETDGSRVYARNSGRGHLEALFANVAGSFVDPRTGTIPAGLLLDRPCPVCGTAAGHRTVMVKYNLPIKACGACGFWFATPVLKPALADDAPIWGDVFDTAHVQFLLSQTYLRYASRRYAYELQAIGRFAGDRRRLLDIGCSVGSFLDVAEAFGWHGSGVDMNRRATDVARTRGHQVTTGTFPCDLSGGDAPYDLVVTLDTMEHVLDPAWFVAAMRRVVAPDGLLFIQVPNGASLSGRLRMAEDNVYNGLIHLNYFTPASLRALVEGEGFETVHMETILSEFSEITRFDAAAVAAVLGRLGIAAPASLTPDFVLDSGLGYKIIALFRKTP